MNVQDTHRALATWCCVSATVACLLSGCKSDRPELSDAGGTVDGECTPFADLVVSFTDASGADATAQADVVLGAADDQSVTVGTNAILTVGFIGLGGIVDMPDADLRVHGSTSGEAAVYVGDSLASLDYVVDLGEGLDIDLEGAAGSLALYVQVVGLSGTTQIDALEALQTVCGSALRGED